MVLPPACSVTRQWSTKTVVLMLLLHFMLLFILVLTSVLITDSGLSTAEAVGITVALYTIFTAGVLVIACYHIYKLKQLRKTPRY